MRPALQRVGAGGDKAGLRGPGAGVEQGAVLGKIALGGLHAVARHGVEHREGGQVQHVGAGGGQRHREGQPVFGGFHGEALLAAVTGDDAEQIAVCRAGGRVGGALPGICEVLRRQGRAVGPGQALAQREGVGQAVLGHGVASGQLGLERAVGGVRVEAGKAVHRQTGAVQRVVERRVEAVRLAGEVDAQRVRALIGGVHEVLEALDGVVDALHAGPHHIGVGVIGDGHHRAGIHEHGLGLVHQRLARGGVGLGLDGGDERVVGGPVQFGAVLGQRRAAHQQQDQQQGKQFFHKGSLSSCVSL